MEAIMADKSYSNCPLKKRPVPVVEHDLPESDGDDEAQPVDLSARKSYERFQFEDRLSDYPSTQPAERLEDFEARFAQPAEFSRFPYSPDSGYMVRVDSRESPASARESSISPPILRVNRTNVDYPHHYQQLFLNHNNNVIKEDHYPVHHRPLISPALSHMSYSSGYSDQATSTFEPEDLSTKAERRRVLLTDSRDNISRTHREQSVRVSDRENRYYQCAICKKCYSTPAGLVKHEQSHSLPQDLTTSKFAETPVLSRVDRAAVDSKTTLSVKHHGAPRYQCPDCGKSYSTYSGLTKHQQFHCPAAEGNQAKKFFSCKNCDKVYVSLGALKMHIRTHTLPCKCPLCGKAFSRPWLLQGHIRTHTGEKPFSCQHCHRAFADRSNLRAHLQTHSDVKKYSCSTCSKTFSRMSLLGKHLQSGCLGSQTGHQDEMTQINCNYTAVDQSVYYKANGSHPGYPSLRHPDYEMHQEYQSAEQPRYKEDVHVY